MNKEALHNHIIKIVEDSQDHYNMGINPSQFITWYTLLSSQEKDIVADIVIENLSKYHFVCISSYVKSEKIFKYAIDFINESIKHNKANNICPVHFSILLGYPPSDKEKSIILYLIDHKESIALTEYVKNYPLKMLSKKYPEYLEKCLPKFKAIYSSYGNSSIIDVYSGLIELHKENFPEVFFKISKNLTEKEIDRVLENLPVIFSDCKHDNIKEEIYTKLEKLFGKSISRKIKA